MASTLSPLTYRSPELATDLSCRHVGLVLLVRQCIDTSRNVSPSANQACLALLLSENEAAVMLVGRLFPGFAGFQGHGEGVGRRTPRVHLGTHPGHDEAFAALRIAAR